MAGSAEETATPRVSGDEIFSATASRGFASWLSQNAVSLAFTTYQVGKLFFIGTRDDGRLWVFNRNVGRCLGLAVEGSSLWVTSDVQILRMENALEPGQKTSEGFDAVYVPQASFFTGDLDIHDLALAGDGGPVFVNTLFNCLAVPSPTHSFAPVWRPSFISRLAAEDRCHLNGLAMADGEPAYATAVARTDTFDAWRDHRESGGIVIDVRTDSIVGDGLSMPHSPRWHDGRLWLHNSGAGEFGYLDTATGQFEAVCFCPGYLRGLAFVGGHAVIGLSKPRENRTFSGLALEDTLSRREIEPRCGLYVVDLESGDIAHSLILEGIVSELYDVAVVNGSTRPVAYGPDSPELRTTVSVGDVPSG